MLDHLFLKGWLIGFFIAMPVGPIGMLCIQHSILRGITCGLVAGLGAAFADTLYGALAAFGVSLASHLITNHQIWFQTAGAIFLCYLGIITLKSKPVLENKGSTSRSLIRIFVTTFFLTLTNPLTFLGFAGLYAGLGIGLEETELASNLVLIVSVFLGSCTWWTLLCAGTWRLGKKMTDKSTYFMHKLSGSVILACGCATSLIVLRQFI